MDDVLDLEQRVEQLTADLERLQQAAQELVELRVRLFAALGLDGRTTPRPTDDDLIKAVVALHLHLQEMARLSANAGVIGLAEAERLRAIEKRAREALTGRGHGAWQTARYILGEDA